MKEEAIMKAFEGRWRVKSGSHPEAWVKGVRELCLDFFEAGVAIASPSMEEGGDDGGFEEWWSLYDKKRAREKCLKKWHRMSASERAACLAATPAYVASTLDKQYRKDPITYLNQKAWNDEIISRPDITQQRRSKLADILVG